LNFGIVNDFTEAEFAAIGRVVWSFTVLEHEFARAAMKLRYGAALSHGSSIDPQVIKILKENLNGRFKCFIAGLKASGGPDEFVEWIDEAEAKFKDGLRWRNRICHGNWRRHTDGRLMVRFVDRESIENETDMP
jgi:predicted pyridoxine 5'-phosphate oxidase superfamily flavin-nucleotide-binding protein